MAAFFAIGEKKVRPGVYYRYENYGAQPAAGADDGKCAAVLRSDWGPPGAAVLLEGPGDIARAFGDGGAGGTTAVALEQFRGGAKTVLAVRLGSGGTNGSLALDDESAAPAVKMSLLHPGSRKFSATLRPTLGDPDMREFLLLDGTAELERFRFRGDPASGQAAALVEAARGSRFFRAALEEGGPFDALAAVSQVPFVAGTDPAAYAAADYSAAFEALEPHRWNVLAADTDDAAVHMLMQTFLNRAYAGGKFAMGVVGVPTGVPFETRLSRAAAFNDCQMVCVGGGFADMAGARFEGWTAAARVAGLIAGTPSGETITHRPVAGATGLMETLSNGQHEQAIQSGMLAFSLSAAKAVWVEEGVNTLVLPGPKEDEGWKKVKRVKVRFELMQRLADTVEGLIGRVNNDPDGRMTIVQAGNAVCNAMMAERKLLAGARCEIDPDNAPAGDSAWFLVFADDVDALEKMYFAFKFRFAPDEAGA